MSILSRALVTAVVLTIGLAPSAGAVLPPRDMNLLKNGNFELGSAATYANEIVCPSDWSCLSNATSVAYGTPTFPTLAESGRIGGGRNFFAGGPGTQESQVYQAANVSAAAPEIDGSTAVATISGCLGGYAAEEDSVDVELQFYPAAGPYLARRILTGPNANRRGYQTKLIQNGTAANVPVGTRGLRVLVVAKRASTASVAYNDGYADNVTLTLGTSAAPGAMATCTPSANGNGGAGRGGGSVPARGDPQSAGGATLSRLGLSASRFRAASSGPAVSRRRRRLPVGTRVSYVVDRSAPATFKVARRVAGVRSGRRCVRIPRRGRGKRRRCTRTIATGSFRHPSTVGANRIRFSGRLRGRKLAPGRYRLTASAGAAPETSSFRIVP